MKKIITLILTTFLLLTTTSCKKINKNSAESTTIQYTTSYITNCRYCEVENSIGTVKEPPYISNPGYILDGWYPNKDFSGTKINFPFTPENDTSLYAKWILVDANKAIEFVFEQKYNNQDLLTKNESIEKNDEKYIYKKEIDNGYYQFELSFDYTSYILNSSVTQKRITYLQGDLIILSCVHSIFSFGDFQNGTSLLNESSIYHKGRLANRNLYSAKILSIKDHKAKLHFTPYKNNRTTFYIYTMTPPMEVTLEDDDTSLETLFNDMIFWCNTFLGDSLQIC